MLKLAGRKCLVVGGGKVAARRARGLSDVGADVTVIAPAMVPSIQAISGLTLQARAFVENDLDAMFMVVIATDDTTLNTQINELAREKKVLVNRADDPDAGDVSIPAHAHCGPVSVAVHTNRISALAATNIRDQLLEQMDPAWPALLTAMQPFRTQLQQTMSDTRLRQDLLKQMANDKAVTIFKEQGVMHYLNYCEMLLAQSTGQTRDTSGASGGGGS